MSNKYIIPKYEGIYCTTEPTRRCLLCGNKENSLAETIDDNKAWICDNCKSAFFRVINEVKRNE